MRYDHTVYLQQVGLRELDFYHGELDGLNGRMTRAAYVASYRALKNSVAIEDEEEVDDAAVTPPKSGSREKVFGRPGVKGGYTPPMKFFVPPYEMRFSWGGKVRRIGCHAKIAEPLKAALEEIGEKGLEWIRDHGLDLYAGCYNPRKSRGGSGMSDHAWAIAIDLNPAENGNRVLWPSKATMPKEAVVIFRKHGFQVGFKKGKDRRDMMHVAYVSRA